LNVTGLGSAPVSISEGVGLPVAVTVKLPAVPTNNDTLFALVITGAAETVIVSVALPVPPAFVALTVTVDVPAAVGVPEITPVEVFTEAHDGNPLAP
jgi:hypothetical protein